MFNNRDVQLTEFENQLLHEEKFELGYRLGLAEGLAAAIEAISEINANGHKVVDEAFIKKLREIHATRESRYSS